jgi:hypothetical protein
MRGISYDIGGCREAPAYLLLTSLFYRNVRLKFEKNECDS